VSAYLTSPEWFYEDSKKQIEEWQGIILHTLDRDIAGDRCGGGYCARQIEADMSTGEIGARFNKSKKVARAIFFIATGVALIWTFLYVMVPIACWWANHSTTPELPHAITAIFIEFPFIITMFWAGYSIHKGIEVLVPGRRNGKRIKENIHNNYARRN